MNDNADQPDQDEPVDLKPVSPNSNVVVLAVVIGVLATALIIGLAASGPDCVLAAAKDFLSGYFGSGSNYMAAVCG